MPYDRSPHQISTLDPNNRELWEKFDVLMAWSINDWTETPDEIVNRTKKFDPRDPLITRIFTMIREGRESGTELSTLEKIRGLIEGSLPRLVVQQ